MPGQTVHAVVRAWTRVAVRDQPDHRRAGAEAFQNVHHAARLVKRREDRAVCQERRIQLAGRVMRFRAAKEQDGVRLLQRCQRVGVRDSRRDLTNDVCHAKFHRHRENPQR